MIAFATRRVFVRSVMMVAMMVPKVIVPAATGGTRILAEDQ